MTLSPAELRPLFETALADSLSYPDYRALSIALLAEGKTTGTEHTEYLLDYTKLNMQRMARWDKTAVLSEEMHSALARPFAPCTWLVITESWCGDAAQNIPMMHKVAAASNGKIDLRLVLRDQHLALMDAFLTRGSRSIPKLICLNGALDVVATWGARPAAVQQLVADNAALPENERLPKEQIIEQVHAWYVHDKQAALQQELIALLAGLA